MSGPTLTHRYALDLRDSSAEAARRCLALVEKHGPKLMLAGGGGLIQEPVKETRRARALRAGYHPGYANRARILRAKGLSLITISDTLGIPRAAVERALKEGPT